MSSFQAVVDQGFPRRTNSRGGWANLLMVLVDRITDGFQDQISPDIKKFARNGKEINRN